MRPQEFLTSTSGRVVRIPTGYYAFIPNPLPPEISWSALLVQQLSAADRALGELAGLGRSLPNPYLLVYPFVRREAVLSSRIEGTRASLADLYAYESVQLSLFDQESPNDVREVYNYVQALSYGLERIEVLPISLRLIRELHARLMEGTRGQERTPGEFRRSQNWIGPPGSTLANAVFVPPPVSEMIDALGRLEGFIHASTSMPLLIQLGLIHYQFEAIHPFLDGNGRVGRLLMTLLMCSWGALPQPLLYLSAYFEYRRQEYYDRLLAVSQRGEWEEWLLFFLTAVETQSRDARQRIHTLRTIQDEYRTRIGVEVHATAGLLKTVDFLFSQPIFTINQVATRLAISYQTARRYIAMMEKSGMIREMTGYKRNRTYIAERILRAIDAPLEESDDAIRPI